ncbi:hypothetical protein FHY52_21860 [Nocardia nova]|jgi:hypothetical protein|nr:hypothetical protein [Nocardia nova]MDN2499303.1 hypothetical protein [Nocardia nova]
MWRSRKGVLVARKRWSELDERTRRLIVAATVVEGILKIAALIDIARRPAAEIRGSKLRWATAVTLLNSAGTVPIAYFLAGRRQPGRTLP